MQMHLTSVVKEYGPLYASWLFAFERYNGVLGDINTNNRQIEGQIMARFLEAGLADSLQDEVPKEYEGHFAPFAEVNEKGESQCCWNNARPWSSNSWLWRSLEQLYRHGDLSENNCHRLA